MIELRKNKKVFRMLCSMLIAVSIIIAICISVIEFVHYRHYKHFVSYGLHADIVIEDSSIGIPGQTKLYWARLSNYSIFPVNLSACEFITDDMSPGVGYPYAVQRWNSSSNSWDTISENNGDGFCEPAPLSKIKADLVITKLWPGKSVETEWEATGAREPFQKGDLARFVVFRTTEKRIAWQTAVASVPFTIEDQVDREDGSFRIKH